MGRSGISLTIEQKARIIEVLKKEIDNENPRSIKKISKSFDFYVSDVSIGKIAKQYFPDSYANIWENDYNHYKYSFSDDLLFKKLFEKLGTFVDVKNGFSKLKNGMVRPKSFTISTRLKNLFKNNKNLFEPFLSYRDWYTYYTKAYAKAIKGG